MQIDSVAFQDIIQAQPWQLQDGVNGSDAFHSLGNRRS